MSCVSRVSLFVLLLGLTATVTIGQVVEIQPFVGYRFGNTVEVDETLLIDQIPFSRFKVENGLAYGASFGVWVHPAVQVEFLWSEQAGEFFATGPTGFEYHYTDVKVDNFHGCVLYHFGDPDGQVRPYVLGGLGATWYNPAGLAEGSTKFSFTWGGGVKVYLGEHFGLRFQGRVTPTYIGSEDEIWCDPWWGCWEVEQPVFHYQFELSAGVILRF